MGLALGERCAQPDTLVGKHYCEAAAVTFSRVPYRAFSPLPASVFSQLGGSPCRGGANRVPEASGSRIRIRESPVHALLHPSLGWEPSPALDIL